MPAKKILIAVSTILVSCLSFGNGASAQDLNLLVDNLKCDWYSGKVLVSSHSGCKLYVSKDENTNLFVFGPNKVTMVGQIMLQNDFVLNGQRAKRSADSSSCYEILFTDQVFCASAF